MIQMARFLRPAAKNKKKQLGSAGGSSTGDGGMKFLQRPKPFYLALSWALTKMTSRK